MKVLAITTIVLTASVAACAAQQPVQNSGSGSRQAPPPQSHPARVRVKLEGFDLASQPARGTQTGVASLTGPARHTGANEIGGGSRGIGAVKLFAPQSGMAYSLFPTFQWSGTPDTKYKLELEDIAAHTTYQVTVDGTSFTYPETAPALKPGSTYSWKVEPEIDMMGGVSDPVQLVVVGGPTREQIETALATITQKGLEGDRARAQVYFDKRVWYDAAAAYSILLSAHPDDSELHRMRGTLYDQVPTTQKLADADFVMVK